MAFVNPSAPNLADFIVFAREQGVTTEDLPDDSPYFVWAFNIASATVAQAPCDLPPILYVLAVYNFGMHQLLKIAQDPEGSTFFATQRGTYGLNSFTAGAVIASSDQNTSETLSEPDFLKGFLVGDLDQLKTPWGRAYLDYAQQYGPNIVGVS